MATEIVLKVSHYSLMSHFEIERLRQNYHHTTGSWSCHVEQNSSAELK